MGSANFEGSTSPALLPRLNPLWYIQSLSSLKQLLVLGSQLKRQFTLEILPRVTSVGACTRGQGVPGGSIKEAAVSVKSNRGTLVSTLLILTLLTTAGHLKRSKLTHFTCCRWLELCRAFHQ